VILARDQAIAFAIRDATARDTVIIAGKGHECYQERDGRRYEFSDLDTASAVLSEVSV
jgi:UDP-N-acetylmuramoyl-L-alanyl-D-glutamate--2,6-diaminopimelate ligase